jgi:hypothetical protein
MTSLDEYQWRYRTPAPSLHEAFAEMAAGNDWRGRRRWRRGVLALAGLVMLGLASGAVC